AKALEQERMGKRSTLLRWWEESEGGRRLSALARKPRKDRDTSKWFDAHPRLKKLAISLYLENPNARFVRDELGHHVPNDKKLLDSRTIQSLVERSVCEAVRARGLKGQKHNAKYGPYLSTGRAERALPNQWWVSDVRDIDVLVADDRPFAERPLAIRPKHAVIQDVRTRTIVASIVSAVEDHMLLATLLRQGASR